jgi:hypothetical protein
MAKIPSHIQVDFSSPGGRDGRVWRSRFRMNAIRTGLHPIRDGIHPIRARFKVIHGWVYPIGDGINPLA